MKTKINLVIVVFVIIEMIGGGQTNMVSNLRALTPCEMMSVIPSIKTNLLHLIPVYNPDEISIGLNGETLCPTDPNFSDFLVQYYKLTKTGLTRCQIQDDRLRTPILVTFNILYLKFLDQYGLRLSCLSFYSGTSQFSSVSELDLMATKLRKREGPNPKLQDNSLFTSNGNDPGRNLAMKLRIPAQIFSDQILGIAVYPESPVCSAIFLKTQDGRTFTVLPTFVDPPFGITIPGDDSGASGMIDARNVNVTFRLSRYLASGLKCVESNFLKRNFSLTLTNWMSNKLIPQLLGTPICVKGYPGILVLMQSIDAYAKNLRVEFVGTPRASQVVRVRPVVASTTTAVYYEEFPAEDVDLRNADNYAPGIIQAPEPAPPPAIPVYFVPETALLHQEPEFQYIQPPQPQVAPQPVPVPVTPPPTLPPPPPVVPPPLPRENAPLSSRLVQEYPPPPVAQPPPYVSLDENYDPPGIFGYSPDFHSQALRRPKPRPRSDEDFDSDATTLKPVPSEPDGVVVTGAALSGMVIFLVIFFVCCIGFIYYCCCTENNVSSAEIRKRFREFFRPYGQTQAPNRQPDFHKDYSLLCGQPREFHTDDERTPLIARENSPEEFTATATEPELTPRRSCMKKPKVTERRIRFTAVPDQALPEVEIIITDTEDDDDEDNYDDGGEEERDYSIQDGRLSEDLHIVDSRRAKAKPKPFHAIYSTSSMTPTSTSDSLTLSEDESQVIFERYADKPKQDLTPSGRKNVQRLHKEIQRQRMVPTDVHGHGQSPRRAKSPVRQYPPVPPRSVNFIKPPLPPTSGKRSSFDPTPSGRPSDIQRNSLDLAPSHGTPSRNIKRYSMDAPIEMMVPESYRQPSRVHLFGSTPTPSFNSPSLRTAPSVPVSPGTSKRHSLDSSTPRTAPSVAVAPGTSKRHSLDSSSPRTAPSVAPGTSKRLSLDSDATPKPESVRSRRTGLFGPRPSMDSDESDDSLPRITQPVPRKFSEEYLQTHMRKWSDHEKKYYLD